MDASTWQISVAVLEGSDADKASIPAGFEYVKLEAATGRKAFKVLGEGMTSLLLGGLPSDPKTQGLATVRFWGGEKLSLELKASLSAQGALTLEQLKILGEAEQGKDQPTMLQTRLGLKDSGWAIAGSLLVHENDKTVRVVLVKAEQVK